MRRLRITRYYIVGPLATVGPFFSRRAAQKQIDQRRAGRGLAAIDPALRGTPAAGRIVTAAELRAERS